MLRTSRTLIVVACAAALGACTSSPQEAAPQSPAPGPAPTATPTVTATAAGAGESPAPRQDCPEPRISSTGVAPNPIRRGAPYMVVVRTRGDISSVRFEIPDIDAVTLQERTEGDWRGSGEIGFGTRPGARQGLVTATDECGTPVESAVFIRWL